MSTFVLVHGAWHGSWCWYKVAPLLQRHGHRVITPDLPAHGRDRTEPTGITLGDYVKRVCQVLDSEAEPVILVGHSMGGIVISQVAEVRPAKITMLVYVTGFLLRNGQTLLEIAQKDVDARVLANLRVSDDQKLATIDDQALRSVFYNDCSEEDYALACTMLVPQPLAPFTTPMEITEGHFGRVPRAYIECRKDHAISLAAQQRMHTASECSRVIAMDRSHSPFFSAPEELVQHLTSLI